MSEGNRFTPEEYGKRLGGPPSEWSIWKRLKIPFVSPRKGQFDGGTRFKEESPFNLGVIVGAILRRFRS